MISGYIGIILEVDLSSGKLGDISSIPVMAINAYKRRLVY